MAISDAELVAQALGGSEAAYAEIVRRFERPLYSLILRLVRDPALAEDLAQDVFVKAIRALASYDPERKFSSWLFKIAHNTTIDHLRRRSWIPNRWRLAPTTRSTRCRSSPMNRSPTPRPTCIAASSPRALDRAVAGLRPEYREVMLLRFREGLAYEGCADITGLPLGTVKTHIHRARKEMAEAMERAGWGR